MITLRDAFTGMKEAKEESLAPPPILKPRKAKQGLKPANSDAPARTPGKSSNPDYEPVKLYVRTKTRRDATRKWEDAGGGDLSDLVELLLSKYLST